MADQPELDLPSPTASAAPAPVVRPKRGFGGFTRVQLLIGFALVAALIWSMWVTKALVSPREDHIVKASLSSIVGEYVSAQARSASPPAQVEAEMRVFMSSLDHELQRRSAKGQVVLVGEAVLTKNVPDITDSLKKAVYASGVHQPRQASAQELQQLQQSLAPTAAPQALPGAPVTGGASTMIDPLSAAPPGTGMQQSLPTAMPAAPAGVQGATISTFGGPNGNDGQ
ncbi:type-F conjugative transfer system protein TrbI [Sphingobium yanoikuyae]|uniref:type-F conjugative transfer system protein TrbI n=1 Tax=Sphingobium yanoikuyae TaxID=13690 RepID=UPI000262C63F|nr:type-F conjugative transfer system protein TrbI [Sphingobium yanoikuyae]